MLCDVSAVVARYDDRRDTGPTDDKGARVLLKRDLRLTDDAEPDVSASWTRLVDALSLERLHDLIKSSLFHEFLSSEDRLDDEV